MTPPTESDSQPEQVPAGGKRAAQLVDRVVRDMIELRWPIGEVVGSESELLERYDVSRAVFREAVRLLEHLGVATTRRGPGGGLIVTEPSTIGVVQAFMVSLTFAQPTLNELIEARISLERGIARLAAQHADDEQITLLRERVVLDRRRVSLDARDHHTLHTLIGTAAKNPAAELFVDVLGRMTARWSYPTVTDALRSDTLAASADAHGAIVDAITAGNAASAERRMSRHLEALGDWLGRHQEAPRSLQWALDEDPDEKLGSRVARAIVVDIVDRDWPVGQILGSEPDLIARYGVSRSALREAVRLLEYHEIAHMKRGPGGGLVVGAPTLAPITGAASVFLEYRGITTADLIALRCDLETDAAAFAIERASDADLVRLCASTEPGSFDHFDGPLDQEFHVRIAELSGNAAIALFVRVLVDLTRWRAAVPAVYPDRRASVSAETDHVHRAIADAMTSRDTALAQRRITKHLAAMEPLLR